MHDYQNSILYQRWIASYDTLDYQTRAETITAIDAIAKPPVVSLVLLSVSSATADRTLRSLMAQLYPYWEIWIAEQDLPAWAVDSRIKIMPQGVAPSEFLRRGLEWASGDLLSPMTSDVSLNQLALYTMQRAAADNPNAEIFYSDEDHLDLGSSRCRPWFKTGWDPDLMLARNLIGQLGMYRRSLLARLSVPDDVDPEAQLYALALAATWSVAPLQIIHVAKLLAHRSQSGSLPSSNLAAVAQRFLGAIGSGAELATAPLAPPFNRVIWPLPSPLPRVTIIIPTRDGAELLARSTSGVLERTDYGNLELLVIDNDTVEPDALALLARLRATASVKVIQHPGAFNYAAMNNRAAELASGDVLVLLNNDIDVVKSDWLRELVSQALRPDVGVVGAKLLYEDGLVQHAGVVFNDDRDIVHQLRMSAASDPGANCELALARTVLAVTGACLAIRKKVFFEIGRMDQENFPVGFNDIDLCLRAGDHGYRVVVTPFAELIHHESASLGRGVQTGEKRARYMAERGRFQALWASVVTYDPFHNPNLAYGWEQSDLATPPRQQGSTRVLAHFDSGPITLATRRWSVALQRLAISRAFATSEMAKNQKILAIVRESEATALQQRDAAEAALTEIRAALATARQSEATALLQRDAAKRELEDVRIILADARVSEATPLQYTAVKLANALKRTKKGRKRVVGWILKKLNK